MMMTAMSRYAVDDEEEFQSGKQLEEDRVMLAREISKEKLPHEEVEQQFSDETIELKFAAEWQVEATTNEEDGMEYLVDLPTDEEEA
jgi:hypothetical protein